MNLHKISFINFGYSKHAKTLDEAKMIARDAGFESVIFSPEGQPLFSFSPLGGMRRM